MPRPQDNALYRTVGTSPGQVALDLVRTADVIAREDLAIGNMTRSAAGTIQKPGRNVAAKSGLNKSILDAGWGCTSRSSRTRLKVPVGQ